MYECNISTKLKENEWKEIKEKGKGNKNQKTLSQQKGNDIIGKRN